MKPESSERRGLAYSNEMFVPKLIGSGFGVSPFGLGASTPQAGFKVQRLLPVDADHHDDQDPEYPT
jgi:hypothetical protein